MPRSEFNDEQFVGWWLREEESGGWTGQRVFHYPEWEELWQAGRAPQRGDPFELYHAQGPNGPWTEILNGCICRTIRIEHRGAPNQGFVIAEYGTPSEDWPPDGVWIPHWSLASQQFSIPSRGLKWKSDGESLEDEAHPFKIEPLTAYTLTGAITGPIPDSMLDVHEIEKNVGKVNYSEWHEYGPETLMFQGADIQTQRTLYGLPRYRIELTFIHKPHGWNRFYRPSTSAWEELEDQPYEVCVFSVYFGLTLGIPDRPQTKFDARGIVS